MADKFINLTGLAVLWNKVRMLVFNTANTKINKVDAPIQGRLAEITADGQISNGITSASDLLKLISNTESTKVNVVESPIAGRIAEITGEGQIVNGSTSISDIQAQIDALGEPFRVKQWASNTLNVAIPVCTSDVSNTQIAKMVFALDAEEGASYQVVGMIAYEVFDSATGGSRINCWPVCQFTGNGQKELSVRWMCGGTTDKVAKRVNAWVLLKHR